MSRLREESGWTMIELMLASSLMVFVLGGALTTFNGFERSAQTNQRRNESQDRARITIDRMARKARNLASPKSPSQTTQQSSIEVAEPTDLQFRTVDPEGPNNGQNLANVSRLRYCLGNHNPTKLWMQTQTWTTADPPNAPSDSQCPSNASGWSKTELVADGVTNYTNGNSRAIFSYEMTNYSEAFSVAADADRANIVAVRTTMWVDADPMTAPVEDTLGTAVFLRNQNRPPTPAFTAVPGGGSVYLNASGSEDPEGRPLKKYIWCNGACADTPTIDNPSNAVGFGITWTHAGLSSGSQHSYSLRVIDQDELQGTAPVQTVTVP